MSGALVMRKAGTVAGDALDKMRADTERRRVANTALLGSDAAGVEKFFSEAGMSKDQFLTADPGEMATRFQQWKVGKADQAYLDTKTALLAAPGRKANLLADPIQGMGKLLGKSVL